MAALVASAVATSTAETLPAQIDEPSMGKFEVVVPLSKSSSNGFQKFTEEELEDNGPIEPAYYYEGGAIPVFTPTMEQFKSFSRFVDKINHYGMQSGIIKVIPPKEWTDSLPPLDEKVKDIRIKNPIEQHIAGNSGEYRQTNVQKQRTYNLPEWRQLCEGSDHQPPARRGERRSGLTQPAVKRNVRSRRSAAKEELQADDEDNAPLGKTNPPTPESPAVQAEDATPEPSFGRQPRVKAHTEETPGPETDSHGRQPRKTSRRKTAKERQEDRELADEVAYEGFNYRLLDADQFTPERCAELEKAYWRTLTYNSPLYGADMPGSLFEDSTTTWNVSKLENLLDCLGKKLPGVNTAYLYLGMWKSTFSWHLEDMDLYSINFIHFGAPKQWYSISKPDKAKFEQVMRGIWPNEAKKCSQFLRHKTFLVSPTLLQQHGIKVNRLVHHQGEFVITFPFGYHSGYNVGYNCAESVNFAQRSWLEFGRDAKKCECVGDSVFVDVDEIERKLRGEPTDDEEESDDEDEYGYYDEDVGEVGRGDFPTPPESVEGKVRLGRSKKRGLEEGGAGGKSKKAKMKSKPPTREPCVLCPNDIPSEPLLYTENGDQAHRLCAIYTPETYFTWDYATSREIVANISEIPKARLELRCVFCRQKKGSCFQCSAKRCTRAYHATCAAAAGVLVNMVDGQVTNDSGETYAQTSIDYRCKIHRPKRPKDYDVEKLEEDPLIRRYATALTKDDVIQMQFFGSDIFAGVVEENRVDEEMVLVRILPKREQTLEVEWKWILAQDPSETNFPDAITTAPLRSDPHSSPTRKPKVANKDLPELEEMFGDGNSMYKWGELVIGEQTGLPNQEPVHGWWYYLGELSTEYISKFSEDPKRRLHNPASNFIPQKPAKARVYKSQTPVIKQELGLHHQAMAPPMQQHIHFQTPLPQPNYAMYGLPPGFHPHFHNNHLVGYGPPPRSQFQPPPHMVMPPRQGPVPSAPSPPNHHHYHNTAAPLPPPDRRSSLSLPLQQLFGEVPVLPPQQRPQYAPYLYNMQHQKPPLQSQSPTTPAHRRQQHSGLLHSSPVVPTPTQQYHSHPPLMSSYSVQQPQPHQPHQQHQQQHRQDQYLYQHQQSPAGPYSQPQYSSPPQQHYSPPHPSPQAQLPPPPQQRQPQSAALPPQDSPFSAFVGEVVAAATTPRTSDEPSIWAEGSSAPLADITAAIEKLARERAEKTAADGAQQQRQRQQQLQAQPVPAPQQA